MKPFNLEEAKAGKPLITRDGRDAKFIAHVPECAPSFRLICLIDGCGHVTDYCENGSKFPEPRDSREDVFMKTVKTTVYVNLYKNGEWVPHISAENARASATTKTFAIAVPIEIEE